MGELQEITFENDSGANQQFHKVGIRHSKLDGGDADTQTHGRTDAQTQEMLTCISLSLILFFQIKVSRLKI
jgi:hypothetical protein